MTAPEVRETLQRAREEESRQVPHSEGGPAGGDQAPSAIQERVRILEMSAVFSELNDGLLRALARRARPVSLKARDTLRLGGGGGDAVVILAEGQVEESVTDGTGKVLLTRRPQRGDLVVLPAARAGDRYITNVYGISDAVLLTLDRDGLLEGLGPNVEKVASTLEKLWEQAQEAAAGAAVQTKSKDTAPIVAFFSAKGGAGTTTLAVNTAAALARTFPRRVLMIDLAAPFGHAVLFADLIATGSIASASKASDAEFEAVIRGNIANHRSGMGVLPATMRPEEVDTLTGEVVGRVLETVVSWQKVVVVDLGTSLSEAALSVIERAECLVVVIPPEIAAMTDARRALAIFRDIMNVPDDRVELVLSQRSPHMPLDRAAVESILGRKMSVVVGFDDSRPEDSTLAGGLVLLNDPSSAVSRGCAEIAKVIMASLNLDGPQ